MGRVWRANDTRLGRDVAVKVLRSELTSDATFLTRFRTEARHAALLTDPNVAAVHDYGESSDADGGAYLVMELVEGQALSDLLRLAPGGLDVHRTLAIVRQTASALAAAHAAGVVHRDVKPANIVVTSTGQVKLTDFGIAWSAANPRLTSTGEVIGTAHYLAPEQVEGQTATASSDVYSLGVVAYECLAGRRPFEGENSVRTALRHIREVPAALPQNVPDDVRDLVGHAMARNPAARLRDGAALRDAIDALSTPAGTPVARQPTMLLPVGPRRRRPGRFVTGVAAVAGLLLLCVLAGVLAGRSAVSPTAANRPVSSPTPRATSAETAPPAIHLAADDLIGRPVAEVRTRLTTLGFRIALHPTETHAFPADAVTALDPVGDLVPGRRITVTYATAPVLTPVVTPSVPPSVTPTDLTTSGAESHKGTERGHGHGHGHGKKR